MEFSGKIKAADRPAESSAGGRTEARGIRFEARWTVRSRPHRRSVPKQFYGGTRAPGGSSRGVAPGDREKERTVLSSLASPEQHVPVSLSQIRARPECERDSAV